MDYDVTDIAEQTCSGASWREMICVSSKFSDPLHTTILPGISAGIFSWYFLRIYVESLNSFSLFSLELSPQTTDFLLVFWDHSKFLTHRSSPWYTSPPTCRHHNTIPTHKFRLPHCSYSLSNSLPVKWFPQLFFERHHRYIITKEVEVLENGI